MLLGDLVSLYLAVLRGADPVEIAPIDRLKAALAAAELSGAQSWTQLRADRRGGRDDGRPRAATPR